jgi:hypothetical protein
MKRFFVVMLAIAGMFLLNPAHATIIKFKVDPTRSALTITPSVNLFGTTHYQVTPQGLGSFTTSYSGSLYADITPTTIQLLAPSTVVAGNSGNWKPGTDYSNYPSQHRRAGQLRYHDQPDPLEWHGIALGDPWP